MKILPLKKQEMRLLFHTEFPATKGCEDIWRVNFKLLIKVSHSLTFQNKRKALRYKLQQIFWETRHTNLPRLTRFPWVRFWGSFNRGFCTFHTALQHNFIWFTFLTPTSWVINSNKWATCGDGILLSGCYLWQLPQLCPHFQNILPPEVPRKSKQVYLQKQKPVISIALW